MGNRTQSLGKDLEDEKIGHLVLKTPYFVPKGTPVGNVLAKMREERTGCVMVSEKSQMIGIFTERDMLTRAIEAKANLNEPIETFMTPDPQVLSATDTVAQAVKLMHEGGYRHIPIKKGSTGKEPVQIIGLLSVRDLVRHFGSNFPGEVYNLPPDPHQKNRAREGA